MANDEFTDGFRAGNKRHRDALEQRTDTEEDSDDDSGSGVDVPLEEDVLMEGYSIRNRSRQKFFESGGNKETPNSQRLMNDGDDSPSPWERRRKIPTEKQPKSFYQFVEEDELKQRQKGIGGDKSIEDFAFKGFSQRLKTRQWKSTLVMVGTGLLVASVTFLGMYFLWTAYFSSNGNSRTWEDGRRKLERSMENFQKVFPSQNWDTAIHFLSAIDSTLSNKEPKQPSCVTILSPPTMDVQFPLCMASRLSKLTNGIFAAINSTETLEVFKINSNYFRQFGGSITKIHQDLATYFNSGGRALVIQDVEKITREDHLLVFHSLCDNFKAPQKRATVFFILPVPQQVEWSYERASTISYSVLDTAWKSVLSDDTRPAVISRITGTVVLLNEGDNCSER